MNPIGLLLLAQGINRIDQTRLEGGLAKFAFEKPNPQAEGIMVQAIRTRGGANVEGAVFGRERL